MSNNTDTQWTDRILCVGLKTSCFGTLLQDDRETTAVLERTKATKGAVAVKKTRLAEPIKPIKRLFGEVRRMFNAQTLPGISDDLRIIPSARLASLRVRLDNYRAGLDTLVNDLCSRYMEHVNADRVALGSAFDPEDYPSNGEALRREFDIILRVSDMPRGEFARVSSLAEADLAALRAEYQDQMAEIANRARNEVHSRLVELVRHISQKMSDPEAKHFHESTFENLREFLQLVPDLNITHDATIEGMRAACAAQLDHQMARVKDSTARKAAIAASANDILRRFAAPGAGRRLIA